MTRPILDRFMSKVRKTDSCWIWTGYIINSGYGGFRIRTGKNGLAHRVSFELFHNKITEGKEICHTCDNKLCVNPDHLWLGTHKENVQDCIKKGRLRPYGNINIGRKSATYSKLKHNDVIQIHKQLNKGISQSYIAKQFNVTQGCISRIKLGKTWEVYHRKRI